MHEASLHDENCFITLTYDKEPWDGSLNKKHFQDFMKRLRRRYQDIRYFHCGEYGPETQRPHYHALLFNHDWQDKELWSERDGVLTYVSNDLEKLWGHGFCTTGDLTFESAAYVTRYALKKRTGKEAETHYERQIGEDLFIKVQPEYTTMSLKPAIGKRWFDTYQQDCYPSDFLTYKGKKLRVPRYYDKLLEDRDKPLLDKIKRERLDKAYAWQHENTPSRLRARETCTRARLNLLVETI